MTTKELKKIREIIARKSSIPKEGESFEDIKRAYDYVLNLLCLKIENRICVIVKCKDCEHYRETESGSICTQIGGMTEPEADDYCSYGKKTMEGNNCGN